MESNWREDALCAQVDSGDVFFPEQGASNEAAKAICRRCGVKDACLNEALFDGSIYGIWGGTTFRERRAIRADRGIVLQSGWPRKERSWKTRYQEARALGLTDLEIMRWWGSKPSSFLRQLDRHGIKPSKALREYMLHRQVTGRGA